jgi:hypothetical protein
LYPAPIALIGHFPNLNIKNVSVLPGQSKQAVLSRIDDSFVTPKASRKSKMPVITFSSDEEEEEEGE